MIKRIAALQHPGVYSERTMRNMLMELKETARASGVELQVLSARGPDDFDGASITQPARARRAPAIERETVAITPA